MAAVLPPMLRGLVSRAPQSTGKTLCFPSVGQVMGPWAQRLSTGASRRSRACATVTWCPAAAAAVPTRYSSDGAPPMTGKVRKLVGLARGGSAVGAVEARRTATTQLIGASLLPRLLPLPCCGGARRGLAMYDNPLGSGAPEVVNCFIEITRESRMKYEWDDELGMLRLDRVLTTAMVYPLNYGFMPQTLCGDGDPLDVLVLGAPILPGAMVHVRPVGYLTMEDEKGLDEKVLAVPAVDVRFADVRTLADVGPHQLHEISHFFEKYKDLEDGKWAKVGDWKGTLEAYELVRQTHEAYVKGGDGRSVII